MTDVIRDHQEYYKHAALDYQSIATIGSISPPVSGANDYFFFLPTLADDDLSETIQLTSAGEFVNTSYQLFDAPGFAAALTVMGGQSEPNLTGAVMQILSTGASGAAIHTTPLQVIQAIPSALSSGMPNSSADQLSALGQYAFSALTNNPVLRGVEAAYAAMAEDRPNDSNRSNINQCVATALEDTWHNLGQSASVSQFQQSFTLAFNNSYRLVYNLNIPLSQVSADGSSTTGVFQLYHRNAADASQMGQRAVTPQDFQKLVLQAVQQIGAQFSGAQGMQTIAQQLITVVQSDDFLKNALWAYDSANQQESDPIGNYQKLARTPMQSPDGDNPFEVDDIDTQTSYDSHVQQYTPSNMKDLITWCMTLAKTAAPEMFPMDSPQHAFNFVPTNPDLAAFVKQNQATNKWLQTMLITPGISVSRKQISPAVQHALTSTMYNMISNALPNSLGYQQLVHKLNAKPMNVRDYATGLLNGINHLLHSNSQQAQEVAVALDAVLIESLSANDQAVLNHSAIRFAFTNWNQGTKNIYFCAYFNPRTEQIGFGSIFEDKTNLQPMDETQWVNGQTWDVDLTPFAPNNQFAG